MAHQMAKHYGPRRISKLTEKLTKPIFRKRGFGEAAILHEWENVVGEEIAKVTCPERLVTSRQEGRAATLHLRVSNGAFATQLIHMEPQLIERLNGYYGYKAVEKIKLIQGPLPEKEAKKPVQEPQLNDSQKKTLQSKIADIDDPELREALEGLGKSVVGKKNRKS